MTFDYVSCSTIYFWNAIIRKSSPKVHTHRQGKQKNDVRLLFHGMISTIMKQKMKLTTPLPRNAHTNGNIETSFTLIRFQQNHKFYKI
jgi:hypothetical protein